MEKFDKEDIENFSTTSDDSLEIMKADILLFTKEGSSNKDQFAVFSTAIDDFSAYISMYVAIRTSAWTLRIAAMKMMAQ